MRFLIFFLILAAFSPIIFSDVFAIDEHFLKVRSQPDILFMPGSGFYNADKVVKLEKAPETWQGYTFVGWKVDGKWADGNPISIKMDRAHTVDAIYEKGIGSLKYTIDAIPRIAEVNVDGVLYFADEFPLTFDWDKGSSHIILVEDVVDQSSSTRYKFDSWKDSDTSLQREVTVEEDSEKIKFTILYKKQHYLKSISEIGTVSGSGWQDEGTSINFELDSEIVYDKKSDDVRYIFDSWNQGDFPKLSQNSLVLDKPMTVKPNWISQYKIEVISNSPDYTPGGSDWYAEGEKAMLVAEKSIESAEQDTKYVFNRWVSKGPHPVVIPNAQNPVTSVNVDKPYVIEAEYKKSYLVSVFSPFGSAQGQGYYKAGEVAEIKMSKTEAVVDPFEVRKVFKGWDTHGAKTVDFAKGDPDVEGTDLGQNLLVFVNGPVSVTANWKSQYYLNVDPGKGTAKGEGWYDMGKMASISIQEPEESSEFWKKPAFAGWSGDIESTEMKTKVLVNGPKNVAAEWGEDYSPGYFNGMILAGLAGIGIIIAKKARKNKLVSKLQEYDWKKRNYDSPFEKYQSTRTYELAGISQPKTKKILSWLMGKSS